MIPLTSGKTVKETPDYEKYPVSEEEKWKRPAAIAAKSIRNPLSRWRKFFSEKM